MTEPRAKTYKRELATALLAFVCGLAVAAVGGPSVPAMEALRIMIAPVFLFAAGAFGLDEMSKNMRPK
ncbi:hypothetical protein K3758_05400 [Sulfitobacter sp. W002]|uniref:hypothetical protein n=1 Tax=Sulfitobacter sp. W002 TaxID=2867024 RepID=UPI0021A9419D|nr:hypothetical protein [Sulfitobacter sp. W002]UWR30965.1 hypothetical protein K3758_05400 [Sulfitobacter sp. W002]